MKPRWTVIFDDKYITDPSGKTDNIAWTTDRAEAEKYAAALGGTVVDADTLLGCIRDGRTFSGPHES